MFRREMHKRNHYTRTPKEIIEMRDCLHEESLKAQRMGNKEKALLLEHEANALSWVLKDESIAE
jgi:hypothetical protein